jgi:pyruvate/2-oxoglutarate dehydrogenase complex dihydrolipoamide acyltransferase (E2) component
MKATPMHPTSMRKPIVMPEMGSAIPTLSVWFADEGEPLYAGDRVVEILLEGTTFDVAAPVSGRLAEKAARPGEQLVSGQVLGFIDEEETL